ncbi:hypothetical protein EZS27_018549 [termite gut metagenome]|uniref:Outer membrane protein beta-barrel domain-containing protein n=1 Tax=termite gut metagenome TaxID=433724 RepID=A0A5J4RHC6_9ZZZZ
MKKENDAITFLFRSRLDNAEMPVRSDLWAKLERDIPVAIHHRRTVLLRFAAAASVLLILMGTSATLWYFSPKEEIADAFSKAAISYNNRSTLNNDAVKEELSFTDTPVVPSFPKLKSKDNDILAKGYEEDEDSVTLTMSMSFSFSSSQTEYVSGKRNQNSLVGNGEQSNTNAKEQQKENIPPLAKADKHNTWSIRLFSIGNLQSVNEQNRGMNMFSAKDNALNVNNAGKGGAISQSDFPSEEDFMSYQRIVSNVFPEEQNTRMKHKQPISVGLTVRKELSKRFALETGFIYTHLSSELSAGNDADYYKQDQTLHYIGIPLKANVSLYKKGRTDLYATAGGMVEKCVSGKIKNAYYEHGERFYAGSNSLQADPLLFSLTLSAGIQYALSDYFSVYAEPGIGYYFNDGSPVASVRKDKPFDFNLLCGVRMTY